MPTQREHLAELKRTRVSLKRDYRIAEGSGSSAEGDLIRAIADVDMRISNIEVWQSRRARAHTRKRPRTGDPYDDFLNIRRE